MAFDVFPAQVSSSINASSITCISPNALYEGRATFEPAIYTITCASSTTATFSFFSGSSNVVLSSVTASGTVAVNLASSADRIRVYTNTGSNIVVTITKTASALSNLFNGVLDTITSTSTYTGTSTSGYAYAIVVGGGGGGMAGNQGGYGGGGGAGGSCGKLIALTGSMPIVVGTAGNGSGTVNANGNSGGASTFAGMTANGGIYGTRPQGQGANGNASGGDINYSGGGTSGGYTGGNQGYAGGAGAGARTPYPFITTELGVGGTGSTYGGGSGTGYGSGGGGAGYDGGGGGNGTAGVVYVLKY
jgi:hypothetical protein